MVVVLIMPKRRLEAGKSPKIIAFICTFIQKTAFEILLWEILWRPGMFYLCGPDDHTHCDLVGPGGSPNWEGCDLSSCWRHHSCSHSVAQVVQAREGLGLLPVEGPTLAVLGLMGAWVWQPLSLPSTPRLFWCLSSLVEIIECLPPGCNLILGL